MSNTIQYHVDEKGNLRSGLYLKGARIIKPGYTIILTIKTESDNVVLKAKTQRDGFAYFQFNILDFIIAAREPFQIRCYTIINRKQISSPWSEVYRMPDWTPSTMGNKNKISLYGTWKSKRWPFKMREERLIAPDYNDQKWTEATIPGALHLRPEFDIPDPQKKDEIKLTHINQDDGFIVRKKFIVPASFRGKTILLKTEGIYPGGKIFLNNRKIGEVWTGLSPIEIDISSSCLIGQENTLAIRIYRRHPFVHLDMPRWVMDYCGIHRPITIEAFPRCRIRDLYLNPTLNDSYTAGILNGKIAITNGEDRAAIITAGIKIFDGNRQHLVKTHNLINQKIASGEPYTANFNLIVGNVKSWSCEKPNLYYAEITLKENGRLTEVVTQRIGFRRFEMRNERPLLNGVPIKIRGINRLECHPETGLAQDEEWLRKEIFMLKRANINGVRTHLNSCHRFIELCDELGLYVIQELPLDWCPEEITDINVLGVLLHRIQASIIRDRNNPSVIVWGVGNENLVHSDSEDEKTAFWTHERLFHHWCKRLDPARPTMFPPAGPLSDFWSYVQAQIGEIGDVHYTLAPIKELQKTGKAVIYTNWKDKYTVSKEELIKNGWSGVWFSSEYFCFGAVPELLESPHLSFIEAEHPEERFKEADTISVFKRRLAREWGFMEKDPACLGGAFFHFKDPATGKQWKWIAYDEGLPWGIVDPYLMPNHLYWVVRSMFAPVKVENKIRFKKGQRNAGIRITNLHSFTNLSEGTCYVQQSAHRHYMGMTQEWEEKRIDVPALCTRTVEFPLRKDVYTELDKGIMGLIRLTFADEQGYIITVTDILLIPKNLKHTFSFAGGDFVLAEMMDRQKKKRMNRK